MLPLRLRRVDGRSLAEGIERESDGCRPIRQELTAGHAGAPFGRDSAHRRSTARPRDAQVPFHRPNLLASVRTQAAVGGASVHLPALATEVQVSLVGGLWADR